MGSDYLFCPDCGAIYNASCIRTDYYGHCPEMDCIASSDLINADASIVTIFTLLYKNRFCIIDGKLSHTLGRFDPNITVRMREIISTGILNEITIYMEELNSRYENSNFRFNTAPDSVYLGLKAPTQVNENLNKLNSIHALRAIFTMQQEFLTIISDIEVLESLRKIAAVNDGL